MVCGGGSGCIFIVDIEWELVWGLNTHFDEGRERCAIYLILCFCFCFLV